MKAKNQNFSQSRATKCRWIPVVLCPCLSLSLLFCLDLCTSSEHCRVTRLPLAVASGTRVQRRRSLQEGGALLALSIFRRSLQEGGAPLALSIFRRSFPRCERAATRSAQLRLAGGHRARAIPIWVRPHDGHLLGFGRTSGGLSDVGRHFSARTRCVCVNIFVVTR